MGKQRLSQKWRVFAAGGGMQVAERLPLAEAEYRMEKGFLRREYDSATGEQIGYRRVGAEEKIDDDLPTHRAPVALNEADAEIAAGLRRGNEKSRARVAAWTVPTWASAVVVRPA